MMKLLCSLTIIVSLLAPSLPAYALARKPASACENGECVPEIIRELEDLGKVFKQQCLPKNIKDNEIEAYFEKNGLNEDCWKKITRINYLETELEKHKANLESKVSCENGNCAQKEDDLTSQITALSSVNQNLTCSPQKKQRIKNTCASDLECVAIGSALSVGGLLVEKLLPQSMKPKDCNLANDNCTVQLATAFFKAAITFFKGSWELLKGAGKLVGNLWDKVTGAEKHSSTSQLALSKASEDEGFFKELTRDFPGTIKKIWNTFVAAIKEWLRNDAFCQKWSGTPHFSTCLEPTETFDCLSCKAMVTGLCSVSGTLIAEIVPAFLTGGIVTAVKYGVSATSRITKLFKVSEKGYNAVKASRVGRMANEAADKVDNVVPITRAASATSKAITTSLSAINKYLLSPLRKAMKTSYTSLSNLMKKGGAQLAVTPAGKVIKFSGTTLKYTAKVVLYPIDNPLTALSYRAGSRTLDKILKLGKPKLAAKTAATTSIIARNPQLETLLAKLDEAKMGPVVDDAKVLKLEQELLTKVSPFRQEAAKSAMMVDDVEVKDIIQRLYPELQYGDLAKTIPSQKLIEVEKELYLEIARVQDTNRRARLLEQFKKHADSSVARQRVVGDVKAPHNMEPRPLERAAALDNYDVPLTKAQVEVKETIRQYMDKSFEKIVDNSRRTELALRSSPTPIVYDSVAVGAGPKNSILVGAMKETNPDMRVLVIESTDSLGTFHRVKGFDINSAEWIGDSGNAFPTSSVHLRDFNINNSAYATAEELGHATQATWEIANPDFLLKTSVTKVTKEPTPGAWPAKYKVETDNGLTVYARSAVVTPGLGTPVNRLKDTASVATVSKYEEAAKLVDLKTDPKYIPRFQDVEKFIENAVQDQKLGRQAVERYRKKTTLLVGDGDGGSIGAEAALGMNRQLNPTGASTEVQLVWMGQGAKTGEEFVNNLSRAKQPRYSRIGEAIDDGRIKPIHGYLSRVEEFTNEAGEIQFKAYYTTKSGEPIADPVIVDNVVFATGYTHSHNTVKPYFSSMANGDVNGLEFVPLKGKLNDFSRYEKMKTVSDAEINKQLTVNGVKEDIYLTGLGAKTPISKRKMKTVTGGFLDIAGLRAAATGQHIAQSLAPQALTKTTMVQMLTPKPGSTLLYNKRPVRNGLRLPNPELTNIHNKIELGKTLRTFKAPKESNFFISIMKNENGTLAFGVHGLDPKSSEKLVDALSSNPRLMDGITRELSTNGNRVDIMIPTRATGVIKNEGIEINTFNIFREKPLEIGKKWPAALMKIMSPSMRAAGQVHNNNKKKEQEKSAQ